jgi:cytochrome P450
MGVSVDVVTGDPFEDFNRMMGAGGDYSPYPELAQARAEGPVHEGASVGVIDAADVEAMGLSLFTAYSYDAVHTVLGDGDTFSSSAYADIMGVVFGRSILEMDEPEHGSYRSVLQQAFTKRAMERWQTDLVEPLVSRMVDGFVDDGRVDLVRELLFPFPLAVIAALLGLPDEDLDRFHRLAVELIGVSVDWDRALRASAELKDYFAGILEQRRAEPREDMISVLAAAEQDGRRLTDDDIFAFCRLLLPAGAETTYRSSSNLMFGLLRDPAQLDAIRADRSLIPQAVEEGIRWEPPLLLISRTATRDTEVCGFAIPAGATVICSLGSANHDEARWSDPERFDIHRPRRPHIGFAHGPHLCLGLHLARMETAVALNLLLDRLPNLRLDPDAPEPYITGTTFRAPPRLDVVWG